MQKAEILEFLNHVLMRQEKYSSLDQVFKFNKITSSRKKNSNIIDSQYNAPVDTPEAMTQGEKHKKQSKKKDPQPPGHDRYRLETQAQELINQQIQNEIWQHSAPIPNVDGNGMPGPVANEILEAIDAIPITNIVIPEPAVHVRPKPCDKTKPRAPGTLYQQIMYADDDSICLPIFSGPRELSSANPNVSATSGTPPLNLPDPPYKSKDNNEGIDKQENPGVISDDIPIHILSGDYNPPSFCPDPDHADPGARAPDVNGPAPVHIVKKAISVQGHTQARKKTADAQALEEASKHHIVGERQIKKRVRHD